MNSRQAQLRKKVSRQTPRPAGLIAIVSSCQLPTETPFFGLVLNSKSSVRNGVTGRPSLENKLQMGLSAQA
jgi:hypothetical protein